MDEAHLKQRLHDAMHRGHRKATEDELTEVTAIVVAIVGEITLELSVVLADLTERVAALETQK